jgi:8-oxo-dGTP diphosphatase
MSPDSPSVPALGVGLFLMRGSEALFVLRSGAHGSGCWGLPGGRVEPGEMPEEAAARECWEEVGVRLEPRAIVVGPETDDRFPDGQHYRTRFCRADLPQGSVPWNREPDKQRALRWYDVRAMPAPLFLPILNLLREPSGPLFCHAGETTDPRLLRGCRMTDRSTPVDPKAALVREALEAGLVVAIGHRRFALTEPGSDAGPDPANPLAAVCVETMRRSGPPPGWKGAAGALVSFARPVWISLDAETDPEMARAVTDLWSRISDAEEGALRHSLEMGRNLGQGCDYPSADEGERPGP